MVRSFLALGSNLGDREGHLREGLAELGRLGGRVVRCASVYSTEPIGFRSQPWFLNTATEVETRLEPEELIEVCLSIEKSHERERTIPNGPRTLDIDIILFGDRIVRTGSLTIPHPRYAERRFVLEPLAEIAPEVVDPVTCRSIGAMLLALQEFSAIRRVGPPLA